jgi:hypothetical protein
MAVSMARALPALLGGLVLALALLASEPAAAQSNCCAANGTPGCNVQVCEAAVCAADSFCCGGFWDTACGTQDGSLCPELCPTGSNCCTDQGGTGCDNSACQTAVCDFLGPSGPFAACCTTSWNKLCDAAASVFCAGLSPFHCYSVKESKGEPKHVKVQGIDLVVPHLLIVSSVDTSKPDRLLVPSTKSIIVPYSDTTHNIDHYKCYKAKTSKGTPRCVGAFFSGQDQFGPEIVDTRREDDLCLPAELFVP